MTMTLDEKLEKMRLVNAERRAAGIKPIHYANPVERAKAHPANLRMAIAAFCWQCMGGEGGVNHREEIQNCTAPHCALHSHRPYQIKHGR